MATGGHHNDGKELRQKIDSTTNGNNLGDRPAGLSWPSLPNNLELNTKSKNTKKKRNKEKVEDHASSAAAKRNIKVPVNQRPQQTFLRSTSKSTMEHENNAQPKEDGSKYKHIVERENAVKERLTHLQDCIAQVNSVLQHLKQSDEPNEADVSNDEADESDPESPFVSKASDSNQRTAYITEEDKANIQNHLLEKMKTSQEKLTALKQQQTMLLTMRRNAEEKLAAFQAELAKKGLEGPSSRDWQYPAEASSADNEEPPVTGDTNWKSGYGPASHVSMPAAQNTQKIVKNGQKNFLGGAGDGNVQELTTLHANLEHIKRRLEILQEYSDDRNVAEPTSPSEIETDQSLSNRLLAVEWQRKKLKNRLLELQEKKKASDELMKELSLIKEAASAVENLNGEESSFALPNIQDLPQLSLHDDNDNGALEAMQETISQLRGMLTARAHSSQENQETESAAVSFPPSNSQETFVKQNSYRASLGKRDNLKKGQGDQFPARRHYEAEGRANEDADVPAAIAAAPAASPTPDPDAWDNNQRKGKKRKGSQEKQQLIQAMFDSIKGRVGLGRLPNSVLQAISLLDNEEASSDNDADTATDNEDSPENDDSSFIVESKTSDTKIKEETPEVPESVRRTDEDERAEASANIDELHNLEQLKDDRDQLLRLHEKFSRLRPKFSSPKQNNEEHRSRAEGGNLQKRKPRTVHPVSVTNPLPLQQLRQENLLTRQNVATVESQSRNNSSNLTRGSNSSLKKDNINDLSAKYNQSAASSLASRSTDLLCKYRTDMKGQDLRDTHHKSPFVDIMKQDRNKLQNYSRNRDLLIHSNSSVNSEPLDGSSSALAPDTTVAATWGGSSTQENFEDENEPFESLEEQEEESNNEDAMVISNSAEASMNDNILGDPALTSVPKAYVGSMPYCKYETNSSSKRRDNRLHKYFKSTQLNQWNSRKNFARPGFQRVHTSDTNREFSVPDDAQAQAEDASQTSAGSINSTNPMPMPDKFIERLHLQLEKLNALCRPVLQDPTPPSSGIACQPVFPQSNRDGNVLSNTPYPLHNSLGRPPQAGPDLMQSYTQQLQLQQQLLLSLSHCYHALYMQQLEIHHLQRCLAQGSESDVPLQQPNPPTQSVEDFTLRPWFLNPWLGSSVPFPPSQVSPMSAPPFLQQSQSAFAFSPNVQVPTTAASTTAPRALVTSIQPARAVVHPAAQDSRTSSETLNNQVPPRTRANNFLDNFRSYSRQNLLSSTNVTKGKESTTTGGPQVRQVHPLVPNESTWGHRSRVFIPPHTENVVTTTTTTTTTAPTGDVRSFVRPVTNSDCQGTTIKSKKPNLGRPHVTQSVPDSSSGMVVPTFSSCPEPDLSTRPFPEDGACAERCTKSKPSTSAVLSPSSQPLSDSIQAEVSRFIAQNSNQEGMLEEFFRELRNIKADSLPRVLGAVKDVANSERNVFMSPAVRHIESDSHAVLDRPSVGQSAENRLEASSSAASISSSNDLSSFKLACESSCQRSNQNWPPATIIPLGKHIPKPSTGAVKKRPAATREPVVCNASSSLPPTPDSQPSENKTPSRADLENAVEHVILEVLPFVQCHNMDDCCTSLRANFVAKAIEAIKNNSSLKLSPESLVQLRQTLMQMVSKYSKWYEIESDLCKTFATSLFQELSLYKTMPARHSADESGDHSAKNSQPSVLSSAKPFIETHKQIIPNKDHREMSVEVDSGPFPVQEFENNVADLYVNMSSQENSLGSHCNGTSQHEPVRGAIGGNSSPSLSSWQNHVVSAEEDTCYECDPEAEGEPEVEAGTEADLAEADQSPAPPGAVNGIAMADGFHVAQPCLSHLSHIISVNSEENVCAEGAASVDNVMSLNLSAQAACNNTPEKEITLDDVPIKLAPMSQEELQRQMAEEQNSNLLLVAHQLDGAEDLPPLAGSNDALKDPPTFI